MNERLRAASAVSGYSLSEEMERRLERSLDADDRAGGPNGARLVRLLENAVFGVSAILGREWSEDKDAQMATAAAIREVVDVALPDPLFSERMGLLGAIGATKRKAEWDLVGRRIAIHTIKQFLERDVKLREAELKWKLEQSEGEEGSVAP